MTDWLTDWLGHGYYLLPCCVWHLGIIECPASSTKAAAMLQQQNVRVWRKCRTSSDNHCNARDITALLWTEDWFLPADCEILSRQYIMHIYIQYMGENLDRPSRSELIPNGHIWPTLDCFGSGCFYLGTDRMYNNTTFTAFVYTRSPRRNTWNCAWTSGNTNAALYSSWNSYQSVSWS